MERSAKKLILGEVLAAIAFIAILSLGFGIMNGFTSFGKTVVVATIIVFLWGLILILIGVVGEKIEKRRRKK